ncbi:fibronectin type III domain-containing protein [Cellulomonas alba]|uniref:Fibronectin type III domain-containing protein n=1 Tax=Cellulomonas alba TaxID=3053467 RepID=A0ABT7SC54_9CELL|nr:fibronectin type III domain-containing protein [Cellulomonas alba]MDM7853765.1 fibronectin type III domain-containing protein [Cellulomonas alba]
MRWRGESVRRRVTSTAAVVTIPVVVAALAIVGRGFPLARVDLNDGGVWLTATAQLKLGRFNAQVEELNGGIVTTGNQFDVLQDGGDVLLVEPTTLSVVDPATVTTTTQVAVSNVTPSMAAGTVAIVDPAGDLYVRRLAGLAGLQVGTDAGDVALGEGGKAVVARDGTVLGVAPADGRVTRMVAGGTPVAAGSLGAGPVDQLTAVGDVPVTLSGSTLRTPHGAVELEGDDLQLQQPGPASSRVLVASRTALLEVPLGGGAVVSHRTRGAGGTPAQPVQVGSCTHAAWAAATGSYLSLCDGRTKVVDLQGMTSSEHLRFRVNRNVVALNDTVQGRVWLPTQDAKARVPNWDDIVPEDTPDEDDQQKDTTDTTQDLVTECTHEQAPPTAADDEFGVRPGRTTILPVLDDDSTSDCGILVVSQFDQLDPDFGTIEKIYGGRALQVEVAAGATGSADFTYTITDGRGSTPSTAHVHLVATPAGNRPPKQVRTGLLRVEQGGQAEQNVLADFTDPDGDDLLLTGARLAAGGAAGTVRFKQDGSLTFVAGASARLGRTTVTLEVSDGTEKTTGTLDVEVRPAGSLAPHIDPVHAVTYVNQPVQVRPLDAVRSSSAEPPRLASVDDAAGATITPDLQGGTFSFASARAGTYYVSFLVVAAPQQATGLARIDVLPWPDKAEPPVAVRDAAFLPSGGQVTIDPLANDSDPAGNVLVVQDVAVPSGSGLKVAVIDHDLVQIRGERTLDGPVSLSYTISNGQASAVGEIVVHPVPPRSSSQAPVVPNVDAEVRTGGVVTIPVLDTAYDPDGDDIALETQLPEPPPVGLMFVSGDVLRYQASGTPGTVRATFEVIDSTGNRTAAQVTVHVHASDASTKAPPRPKDLTARVFAGDTVRVSVPLVGIDSDGDGVTLLGQASAPKQGRVVDQGADWLEFEAYADAVGTDAFTYAVEDWTGQRAVATVRIGIAPRPTSASSVVARDDEVTVKPDQTVEVRVLANDVDSSGADLSLDASLEMPQGTDAHVEGRRIVVHAPSKDGTIQIAYTARDERGGHDSAVLTVKVVSDAPVLPPIARDVVVPATETIDRTEVVVDVLAVAQNPSGPLSDLQASVPAAFAAVARVDATGKVVVTLADHAQTVPFLLTNTTSPGGKASSYAFITVPALGFFPPTPRPKAPELRVASGQPLVISLDEQIQVAPGRSPSVADPVGVTATRSDGSSLVKSSTQLQFTSAAGYAGPASITVPVTDARSAGDSTAHTAVITLPITVFAVDDHPPAFDASVIDVAPGEEPLAVDLRAFTHGPEGATGAAAAYTYTVSSAVPAGFTASLKGSVLSVGAAVSTPKGRTDSVDLRIGYGTSGHLDVSVPLRVVASTRPTARVVDTTIADGVEGVARTVAVLEGAYNPFPGQPLLVVGAAVETPDAGTAGVTGSTVSVRPAVGFIGQMVTRFTVRDVTGDPDRAVEGRITVVVRGKPAQPDAPQVVSVGDRSVVLSWVAPDNRGAAITGYEVVASPGHVVQQCPATTCTITGLTNDVDYTFTVAARNAVGTSDPSLPSGSARPDTVPDAPAAPTLRFGDRRIEASWVAPHSSGSPVTGYTLMITPAPPSGPSTVDTTSTSYTFEGLANGTRYAVQVRAHNRAPDPSEWSPAAQETPAAPPDAPGDLVAQRASTPLGGQISVSWTQPADNGAAISGYELTITGNGSSLVKTFDGTATTSYALLDARNGVGYHFAVRARNRADWGPAATVDATTFGAPTTPENVSAVARVGAGAIDVSWSPSDGNGSPIAEYHVRINGGDPVTVRGTSYTADHLTGGQSYVFVVQAQNAGGGGDAGYVSGWSDPASATATTPPGTPNVSDPVVSDTAPSGRPRALDIAWSAPAPGSSAPVSYTWTVTGKGGSRSGTTTDTSVPGIDVSGWNWPVGGTAVTVSVTATTVVSGTTLTSDAGKATRTIGTWGSAPGAVTDVTLTPDQATDPTQLTVAWTDPTDTGGLPITGHDVQWQVDGGAWTAWQDAPTAPVAIDKVLGPNPTPGDHTITVAIRASNDVGASARGTSTALTVTISDPAAGPGGG